MDVGAPVVAPPADGEGAGAPPAVAPADPAGAGYGAAPGAAPPGAPAPGAEAAFALLANFPEVNRAAGTGIAVTSTEGLQENMKIRVPQEVHARIHTVGLGGHRRSHEELHRLVQPLFSWIMRRVYVLD